MSMPYVGITGFTGSDDIMRMEAFARLNLPPGRRLMVGILASWKSMHGITLKSEWHSQYPDPGKLEALAAASAQNALCLIHYNSKIPGLAEQLAEVMRLVPSAAGFQLNIDWPSPDDLRQFGEQYPDKVIVIQLSPGVLRDYGNAEILRRLGQYAGLAQYVLFDVSGGVGVELDIDDLGRLRTMIRAGLPLLWAVAGGLHGSNLDQLRPLLEVYPSLSWDAQAKLRLGQDLHSSHCRQYLQASADLLYSVRAV